MTDDPRFRRAVEAAARELFDACAKDMPASWTWDTARPAHKAAYRRLTRRMLVAVLAEVRTAVKV
jgi:hypothetical protein